jgi:putative transposase
VKRAYKLRAYPTRPQEGRAVRLLADHCDLYNAALQERREAWRLRKVGYPRFKPYRRFDQVLFVAGNGAKWDPADGGRWAHASFQAVGRVKVRQHRPVMGRVKTLQLKREHRRCYVIVVTETEPVPLPSTDRAVGIDLGVARFLTTSDGEIVANPRFLDAAQMTIAALQRRNQQARPGSGNRRRLRRALAREFRKIRNKRRDFHHKTARALVDTCDAVALEALRMNGMTASARGTVEQPGTNVAAKSGLNRSILDAGWAQFMIILTAKAESAGRRVVRVEPSYTSVTCHTCGARCSRPRQDTVVCPTHGELDADLNRARNIATRAGLGSGQASAA